MLSVSNIMHLIIDAPFKACSKNKRASVSRGAFVRHVISNEVQHKEILKM
jgi:hypothetical protein